MKKNKAYHKIIKDRGWFRNPEICFEEVEIIGRQDSQQLSGTNYYSTFALVKKKDGKKVEIDIRYLYEIK